MREIDDPSSVEQILLNSDYSTECPFRATRVAIGRSMVDTDGGEHDLVKGMIAPFFNQENVEKRAAAIEAIVRKTFVQIEHQSEVDVLNDVAFSISMRVAFLLLGIDEAFLHFVRPRLEAVAFFITDGQVSVDDAVAARRDIEKFTQQQWGNPELSGPLGALYQAQAAGVITRKFALHNATLLLVSSISTSVAAICLVFRHLGYQEALALRGDSDLMARWLVDLLRHHPPLAKLSRFKNRQGDESGSAQAEHWVNLSLECDRVSASSGRSLSFGIGEHACLGSRLAMRELMCVTKVLATRVRPTSRTVIFEEREGALKIPAGMVYSW